MSGQDRREESRGMLVGGLIVAGVGLLFLLVNLGLIPRMDRMWPILPMIVGAALIAGALVRMRGPQGS